MFNFEKNHLHKSVWNRFVFTQKALGRISQRDKSAGSGFAFTQRALGRIAQREIILPMLLLLMCISATWVIMALRPRIVTQAPRTEAPRVSVLQVVSGLDRLRTALNQGLDCFVERYYRPFLQCALDWRYLTLAGFMVLILQCAAWVNSGRIRLSVQADVVKDSFWVSLKTPQDMPYSEARHRAAQVEKAFFSLRDELDESVKNPLNCSLPALWSVWRPSFGSTVQGFCRL
ncbi:MAG: hypothetical protein WAW61_00180 [Methylococcaceae bacterium]